MAPAPSKTYRLDYRPHIMNYYACNAEKYDRIGRYLKSSRDIFLRQAQVRPGMKILDACTGTGDLALTFAAAGGVVTAVDFCKEMLEVARRKPGGEKIEWQVMDVTKLKFNDKNFELSTLSLALHYMPWEVQLEALRQLTRVTTEKVIFMEPAHPQNSIGRWLVANIGSALDESRHFKDFVYEDWTRLLNEAGLTIQARIPWFYGIFEITVCHVAS